MKKFLLIFIVQLSALLVTAQRFAIGADKNNIFYLGIDNPVSIAVENCPCNNIVLKIKNGNVTGRNCQYLFTGDSAGAAKIPA